MEGKKYKNRKGKDKTIYVKLNNRLRRAHKNIQGIKVK